MMAREHPKGTILVVSDADVTTDLAAQLCDCDVEDIPDTEYGTLYEIAVADDGQVLDAKQSVGF